LALDPAVAESDTPSHRRLRRLSRVLSWLFTALLVLLALYLVAGIVVVVFFSAHVQMNAQGATLLFGPHGEIPPATPGMVRFSDQPVAVATLNLFCKNYSSSILLLCMLSPIFFYRSFIATFSLLAFPEIHPCAAILRQLLQAIDAIFFFFSSLYFSFLFCIFIFPFF